MQPDPSTVTHQMRAPWTRLYEPAVQARRLPQNENMLCIFRAAVTARGDQVALYYFDGRLSYAELDQLSDALASWLHQEGVGAGDRIVVSLQDVPHFVIIALAAWKLNAVFVPTNPVYSAVELGRIFDDAKPKALFCEQTRQPVVQEALQAVGLQAALIGLRPTDFQTRNDLRVFPASAGKDAKDEFAAIIRKHVGQSPPLLQVRGGDLAMLMYTSGTTGLPKGVMLRHSNIAYTARISELWWKLDHHSVNLVLAPLFHISGFVTHMCATFCAQGPMVLTYRMLPNVTLDAIREFKPTFTTGSITAFNALMNVPGVSRADFVSFERVVSGGAPIPPALRALIMEKLGFDLYVGFGMTETAAPAVQTPFGRDIPVDPGSGALAVGVPMPGVEVMIVGDDGQALPAGQAGELCVRGPTVMAGYWNRPKETAETLSNGWLRTGDVGVMDEPGWVYLVDRKKDVIIASGYKVWPREVEDWLYTHPAVREVAVVGAPDAYRGETVVAYVSLKNGAPATEAALIEYCRGGLAPYKRPHKLIVMPDLPKTVSGKIQRHILRQSQAPGPSATARP